jgi:hypothetical protein
MGRKFKFDLKWCIVVILMNCMCRGVSLLATFPFGVLVGM